MHSASPSRTIKQKTFKAVRYVGSTEIHTQHHLMHMSSLESWVVPVLTRDILNRRYLAQLKKYSFVGAANKVIGTRTRKRREGARRCPRSVRRWQTVGICLLYTSPLYSALDAHALWWQRGSVNAAERETFNITPADAPRQPRRGNIV